MKRPVATVMRGGAVVSEAEADVRRSAEEVFDYASDPANVPEWNIRVKRVQKLTGGPVGVGARYRMAFTRDPLRGRLPDDQDWAVGEVDHLVCRAAQD